MKTKLMKIKTGKITLVAILAMLIIAMLPMSALAITVSTDKVVYAQGELVTISGKAAAATTVNIEVRNPLASLAYFDQAVANAALDYTTDYRLPIDALMGVYTVHVSAPEGTTSTAFTVGVAVPDFTTTLFPEIKTVPQGESTSVSVIVTAIAEYDQEVTLSATEPTGVTVSFSPTTSRPTFTSIMSVTVASTVAPGIHLITVTGTGADDEVHPATFALTVTSAAAPGDLTVYLSESSGNVGDKIKVSGYASPWSIVTLYWEDLSGQVLGTAAADSTGAYELKKVTIPSAVNGPHFIVANAGSDTAGAVFTVIASLKASTTPKTADITYDAKVLPSDALTLTGNGFSEKEKVTVTFAGPAGTITLTVPTITTDATGSFSAVVTVPAAILVAEYGAYMVTATDAENIAAGALVLVDYYNTVTPPAGPPGIIITISGRIPANMAYSLLIDDTTILTGTSGTDGKFSQAYTIPALIAQASHTITVRWTVATVVNNRAVTFKVTAPPQVSFTPTSGVPGKVVTISTLAGKPFSAGANITLYLGTTVVNSTQLDDRFGPTVAFGPFAGTFTNLEFTVPALASGVYTLTVVDEYGASTGTVYTFTVKAAPVTTVALRATSYFQGDTISFNIVTTDGFIAGPAVTIKDPTGQIWWTDTWTLTVSVTTWSMLYQDQVVDGNPITLPADAPLGIWNWTITYTPASTLVSTKATGLFAVSALPTMQLVLEALDALDAKIVAIDGAVATISTSMGDLTTSLSSINATIVALDGTVATVSTSVGDLQVSLTAIDAKIVALDGKVATISTNVGTIKSTVSGLDSKITSVSNGMATVQTSLGTVTTSLESLDVVLGSMYGDVVTLQTSIGTVQTSLDSLDTTVTSIDGDVATIQTSIGTLQGTVTSIDGDIATIDTEVGTIKADISTVQAEVSTLIDDVAAIDVSVDMSPVWIAVVLSVVAAIAACYAVITIRQKIAG